MGLAKTLFETTNFVLDLTSVGMYGYVLGRKYAWDKIKDTDFIKNTIAPSISNGYTEISNKLPASILEWVVGGNTNDCKADLKPNWVNLNEKIALDNNMAIASGVGMVMLGGLSGKSIFSVVKHVPLAVPLAAVIDRDGNPGNDSHLVKVALGIAALDTLHYLTCDGSHPEL